MMDLITSTANTSASKPSARGDDRTKLLCNYHGQYEHLLLRLAILQGEN